MENSLAKRAKKRPTLTRLPVEMIVEVDQLAAETGLTKSALMRNWAIEGLARAKQEQAAA